MVRVAIAALAVISLGLQVPSQGLSRNDREIVQTMLHQIRDDLEQHYYDPTFHGIDVKAHFAEAEQRLLAAPGINEAIAILSDTLIALDDSHTAFFPPTRATRADYGWRMALVGDAPLVVDVTPGSDAAAKGLAPGDRVLALNRFQPSRDNLWQIQHFYQFVRPQAQQRVVVSKPDGTERTFDIASTITTRRLTELDDLIAEVEESIRRARDRRLSHARDIEIWQMRAFVTPDAVQEGVKEARPFKALVLDLRDNGGGAATALLELVSRMFDHEVVVATEKRRNKERTDRAKPKDGFRGTLVVLVDSRTGSAAEMFARTVQLEKRGTVVGDRTAGAVMTAQFCAHGVGVGAVAFYANSITIGDVRMSDGNRLEKIGVMPDEVVLPTQADLAARRDPALARAIVLAGGTITAEAAGRLYDRK